MLNQNQLNNQLLITKEIFIDHVPCDIEQNYEFNPKCLGSGGFGQVFEAKKRRKYSQFTKEDILGTSFSSFETCQKEGDFQQQQSQYRAIKRINLDQMNDKSKMKNEIQVLSYLDHPSILKLYQTYEHKKRLYLVTDLLKGGDLFSIIEGKRQSNQQSIRIVFRQIIKALCYLHSQNVCHRDLKLENILFLNQENLNVKVIDFGLAYCWEVDMRKQLKKTGENKKLAGTVDYMSPQMLEHNYDERCDIWSSGVILYMLLTKCAPFFGDNDREIIANVKKFNYSLEIPEMSSVSDEAKDLINKIFTPQDQRISLSEILSHPWMEDSNLSSANYSEETYSVVSSAKQFGQLQQFSEENRKKFRATRSFDKIKKDKSLGIAEKSSQSEFGGKSYFSEQLEYEQRPEALTVEKMQHFCKLSKLQKLISIYSVSRLSESKTHRYGDEYISIDKNNNGTIELQDLNEYLFEIENFCDKQKTQQLFTGLVLSKRGYISYTEYLACVLSFNTIFKRKAKIFDNFQEDQLDERFSFNPKIEMKSVFDNLCSEFLDIYNDQVIHDVFYFLDSDKDGFLNRKDFRTLFENNGIEEENACFVKDLQKQFDECTDVSETEQLEENDEWLYDPRKFKPMLSRSYKGDDDGGIPLDIKTFKSLICDSEKLLKITIL